MAIDRHRSPSLLIDRLLPLGMASSL